MAQPMDLNRLSREELLELACRIEERIWVLSEDASGRMAENAGVRSCPTTDAADPRSGPHVTASEGNPEIRTTLSEKVQELIFVNDPWEGSGIGPTRWSLPFYGGHIVRCLEVRHVLMLVVNPPRHLLLMSLLPLNLLDAAGTRLALISVLFAIPHAA